MKIHPSTFSLPKLLPVITLTISLVCASAIASPSQSQNDAALKQQIAELQAKIKQLEAALPANSPQPTTSPAMPGMNMSPKMTPAASMSMTPNSGTSGAMGMGDMNMGSMPKNPPNSAPMPGGGMGGMMTGMMGMMNQMMGMGAMPPGSPGMAGSQPGTPQSALPGFPGVSHLYHIGSTGFFLDHAEHINLSTDQKAALSKIKEQALAAKTNADRQIEQAELEMATLTSADQPDGAKIETKVRDIEKLRTDERLAFIRAVGEAANLLTDDQRKILTGAMQPQVPLPSATMSPMSHM
jgi:Spy/CpxP family protein refolding chaperone